MAQLELNLRERHVLQKLGEAVCPETAKLPGFGDEAMRRIDAFLADFEEAAVAVGALRTALWVLEQGARRDYLRPMSQLDLADRIRYLERRWRDQVGTLRGLGFRMLLLALRAAYLSDPKVFEAIGCDYYKPAVTPSSTPRWQQQILHGRDIDAPLEFEAEVVVVGTGAGGAVIACELARQGNAVVMVEAGEHFTREQFNGRPYEMQRLMYAHRGLTVSLGNASVVVPYGETVGGTTTINSGTCFRPPERTLRRWQRDHGLSDYTPEMLAPYLDRAEHGFEVATADMKVIGPNGAVAARGADALGLSHHPLRRNATDCDGQSVCCYGCPTDAKRSTNVTYVPKALQSGAQLLCRVRADEVLLGGGEVRGLRGHSLDTGQAVTIKAPVVVLAAGAFGTPMLLMQQRICNSSRQLGRNLSLHPATLVYALMRERIDPDLHIPQGYAIDAFEREGLLIEGITLPLDLLALTLGQVGFQSQHLIERYKHMSFYSPIICDVSRGQVRPGRQGRPRIYYWLQNEDFELLLRGVEQINRVFLAAGAQEVHATLRHWRPVRDHDDLAANLARRHRPLEMDISAYHPLGTCHMGGSRNSSVCDPNGETWDLRNLFIADGSTIPPALGVNPQITIAAVATRTADFINDRLSQL